MIQTETIYTCFACALDSGGVISDERLLEWHMNTCPSCKEEKLLALREDFNLEGEDE